MRKRPLVRELGVTSGLLAALVSFSACVPQVESTPREQAGPIAFLAGEPVQATKDLLQSLRAEVIELLAALPGEAEPDGMALLRRGGKLFYWGVDEDLPKDNFEWVRDAWGQPVMLLCAQGESRDWCLASAGPDRAWTTDGMALVTKDPVNASKEVEFLERAPHYHGEEEAALRQTLGDDIILHSTGLFFRAYDAPVPHADEAFASLLGLLRGHSKVSIQSTPDLEDELGQLTEEERDLAIAFLRTYEHDCVLREDTWSHECKRRNGLLPRIYLWNRKLAERAQPFIWIEPREDGWTLDWDVDELFRAVEEGGRKPGAR